MNVGLHHQGYLPDWFSTYPRWLPEQVTELHLQRLALLRRDQPRRLCPLRLHIGPRLLWNIIYWSLIPEAGFSVPRQNLSALGPSKTQKASWCPKRIFFPFFKLSNLVGPTWPTCHLSFVWSSEKPT